MRFRPWIWILLCLLIAAGLMIFWPRHHAPKTIALTPGNLTAALPAGPELTAMPDVVAETVVLATNGPNAYRLANTRQRYEELIKKDSAILLENAVLDTALPMDLQMPDHLRATVEPGAYIVKSRALLDDAFRQHLRDAGAEFVSYIPHDAALVRASAAAAAQLQSLPDIQTVLPWEPYYKLRSSLLATAVKQERLPEDTWLNLLLFAGADARGEIEALGNTVIGRDVSPFGPVVRVIPDPEGLSALARLPGVQSIERAHRRVHANDLMRVQLGVAADSVTTTNYLGLTGAGVTVNVTDSGVDAAYPGLAGRVFGSVPVDSMDLNGHGTHVATIIAGDGTCSTPPTNLPSGSLTNDGSVFRGIAPAASIYSHYAAFNTSLRIDADGAGNPIGIFVDQSAPSRLEDGVNQEIAATNAFISNNSWHYEDAATYDLAAASYDAAVRDSLPGMTGAQPVLYVFPAGNQGTGENNGTSGDPDRIQSPGTAKNVITVGALEQPRVITNEFLLNCMTNIMQETNGNEVTVTTNIVCVTNRPFLLITDGSGQVAFYSSRGNVGIGVEGEFGRFKPDLVAPGSFVISGRSTTWDADGYYRAESHDSISFPNIIVPVSNLFINAVFVPNNAVRLTITVNPNNATPAPMPDMPIYVNPNGLPTLANLVGTNQVTIPGPIPLSPKGGLWFYAVGNTTTQDISVDILSDVVVTNEGGGLLSGLQTNLNAELAPCFRYESGTSMSAAAASGTLALMMEHFNSAGIVPSPALLKAMLINGARSAALQYDLEVQTAVNFQGWGAVNLPNSLPPDLTAAFGAPESATKLLDQSPTNALATGQSQTRRFTLSEEARELPLRVTLAWTDPPGNPVAAIKLVNDLDLVVTNLDSGQVFFGNDIPADSNFTFPWDTNSVENADVVNNVENVYVIPPIGTNFSVTVRAHRVNVNAVNNHPDNVVQDYALVISSGSGTVSNALTFTVDSIRTAGPDVTFPTNSFEGIPDVAGSLLLNQHVGANPPLLGTTNGLASQWHFYVLTNPATNNFTNAAFLTFLAPTFSIPREGVEETAIENATRLEADIDLFVSTTPNLTNLNPATVATAYTSVSRGGTEIIVLSNAVPGQTYYVGVKSEDYMASEYGFLGIFSLEPFSSQDEYGNVHVRGLPVPTLIPDGTPANPGSALVFGIAVQPLEVRRVVITNVFSHNNLGDLVGVVTHNSRFTTLLNHRSSGFGTNLFIFEDNNEQPLDNTDGPGSLRDFIGVEGAGLWLLSMIDNSESQVGAVEEYALRLEPHIENPLGVVFSNIPPMSFVFDFVDVPPGTTNLTVCVTNLSMNPLPLELYLRKDLFPTRTEYDYFKVINPPGDCLTVTPADLPPLTPGRYYIGIFNPNTVEQTALLVVTVLVDPSTIVPVTFNSIGTVPILDDAITNSSIFVTNVSRVATVEVGLRVDHPRVSDLAFTLISPRGTRVLLMENRGRTNDTGIGSSVNFTNISPQSAAGGPEAVTNIFDAGVTEGTVTVEYDFFPIPDRMTIYYEGRLIYDSGFVSGADAVEVSFGPGTSTLLAVVMNEGGNANMNTQWEYTISSIQSLHSYLTFTEDTNKTTVPIKFAVPPFNLQSFTSNALISDFDSDVAMDYVPPAILMDGWEVLTNRVTVTNDPALVNAGSNSLVIHDGTIRLPLTVTPGKTYSVSYAYRRHSLFDGVVSWWYGDEDATDAVDGNDGALAGDTFYTPAIVQQGFEFDGDQDGVVVGTNANLHLQDFSIEGWIRRSSLTDVTFGANSNGTIFAVGTTGTNGGYAFYLKSDASLGMGIPQFDEVTSPVALVTNLAWHHVAVTKSGTTVFFYVDGVAFPTAPYVSGGFTFEAPGCIGGVVDPMGQLTNGFFGAIDELAVFNRALTPMEVQAIYLAGSTGKCIPFADPRLTPTNDITRGFSTNSNPTGVWSYGYSTSLGGPVTLYDESGLYGPFEFWRTNILQSTPMVFHNPFNSSILTNSILLGARQVASHPGPNGEFSIVRYTVPATNVYELSAIFSGADTNGTTSDVHILLNGTNNLFDEFVDGFGSPSQVAFTTNILLELGDTIDFVVGYGTNSEFSFDATAINARILLPSPCETSPALVFVPGSTNTLVGDSTWRTNNLFFTARSNTALLYVTSEDGRESDLLVDSFVLWTPPDLLFYLPEESLEVLENEVAFGDWQLEIWDSRLGAAVNAALLSWRLDFVFQTVTPFPIPLPPFTPVTNTAPANGCTYFTVDVPSWATFATNRLITSDVPVNIWFNQFLPPAGMAPPDSLLIGPSVGPAARTLNTNGVPPPPLLPGQRYYLCVMSATNIPANFVIQVDYDIICLTNMVPYTNTLAPGVVPRYFCYDVSTNATAVSFELFGLNANANLVARYGVPLPTDSSYDYGSFSPGVNEEDIVIFTNTLPVPLAPGTWYLGVYNADTFAVDYTIMASEFTNAFPTIITLTNGIPYTNQNSGPLGAVDYYRYVVSSAARRVQFEINNPSDDMTLLARKGLPLPSLGFYDYISANVFTNDELIVVLTNSTPVPVSPGDWFLAAFNLTLGPVDYSIKATEWPFTGRPVVITGINVTTNSFCITWDSLPGAHYFVEGVTNLPNTNWVAASPTITATSFSTTYCVPLPSPLHFFRVVEGLRLSTYSPPVTITSIASTPGGILLQWAGPASATFEVQWSNALVPAMWNSFTPVVMSNTGLFMFLDDGSQTGGFGMTRFYRLVQLP